MVGVFEFVQCCYMMSGDFMKIGFGCFSLMGDKVEFVVEVVDLFVLFFDYFYGIGEFGFFLIQILFGVN